MKTTIDAAGRLVVPKELRKKAGLEPGAEVEVRYRDGIIEIEASSKIRLERRGRLLVAVVEGDAEPMTTQQVNRLIDEDREARMRAILGEDHEA